MTTKLLKKFTISIATLLAATLFFTQEAQAVAKLTTTDLKAEHAKLLKIANTHKALFVPAYYKENAKNVYKLSVPLMVMAILRQADTYAMIRGLMVKDPDIAAALKGAAPAKLKKPTFTAWMMGRLSMAPAILGKNAQVLATVKPLEALEIKLEKVGTVDVNTFWAWQYLAISYAKLGDTASYKRCIAHTRNIAAVERAVTKPNDQLWVWVTHLLAAATAKDWANYHLALGMLAADQPSWVAAIDKYMPFSDYRTWVFSYVQYSAALMGDEKTYKAAETKVDDYMVAKGPIQLDRILAQVNQWRARVIHAGYTPAQVLASGAAHPSPSQQLN